MAVLLIPGFWLDASSWDAVLPALAPLGDEVRALTLPGLTRETTAAERAGITLRDHVEAVVAAIDEVPAGERVVLVGHSGGGPTAYGAADARPERVSRLVYVDAGPLSAGDSINDGLPVLEHPDGGGEIPLPAWDVFDDADLVGLDDDLRAAFHARAIPQPAHVAADGQQLSDDPGIAARRRAIPATVICCEFPATQMRELMDSGHPYGAELATCTDVELVDLPTGHWPQFSRPADLGAVIVAAVR